MASRPIEPHHVVNSGCSVGLHRPRRVPIGAAEGMAQTTCRDCGCRLVRTLATRRWVYSGSLGRNPAA